MRILVEACGSLACYANIKAIQDSGNECIATDADNEAVGGYLADEFYPVPLASGEIYSETMKKILMDKHIDLVLPTLDDGLLKWANMAAELAEKNVFVALSNKETLEICLDKWKLYNFFIDKQIPTPRTSLYQDYALVKPRQGRGGTGVCCPTESVNMGNMISQELLVGEEYTVDVFCNIKSEPVYIVPRKRSKVLAGKSINGVVVKENEIESGVRKICKNLHFVGPINIQCFMTDEGVRFTEINPRLGGGSALGQAATENWIPLVIDTFVRKVNVTAAKEIKYGLKMKRYLAEKYVY